MQDFQSQIEELKNKIDQMSSSTDIDRDNETALRERLGLANGTQAFPVGSIFLSTVTTNPSTLLGYGTWAAFGTGQVLVGYDAGQTEFHTLLGTGGEKTHTLTTPEIPAHTHTIPYNSVSTAGAFPAGSTGSSGTEIVSDSAGGGGSHNNLQPYIVIQMWKRTA